MRCTRQGCVSTLFSFLIPDYLRRRIFKCFLMARLGCVSTAIGRGITGAFGCVFLGASWVRLGCVLFLGGFIPFRQNAPKNGTPLVCAPTHPLDQPNPLQHGENRPQPVFRHLRIWCRTPLGRPQQFMEKLVAQNAPLASPTRLKIHVPPNPLEIHHTRPPWQPTQRLILGIIPRGRPHHASRSVASISSAR